MFVPGASDVRLEDVRHPADCGPREEKSVTTSPLIGTYACGVWSRTAGSDECSDEVASPPGHRHWVNSAVGTQGRV